MAAEGQADNSKAIDELLALQHVAQSAPVDELALSVAVMFDQLAGALDAFNQLAADEPCSCGCTPAATQDAGIQAITLAIHIAIYSLAIGQRNPAGLHILIGSESADLN
jgi:hypothetical protein